jgi:hypothetical protein
MAQQDYYTIYNQIIDSTYQVSKITDAHFKLMQADTALQRDTVQLKIVYQNYRQKYASSVQPLYQKILNKSFPDISFSDKDFKSYNLSDFSKFNIILNYNYFYCKTCMNRIDSTLRIIDKKDTKLLVLFQDIYRKDADDLARFEDNIVVGFMTPETTSLISFDAGDDKMFFLNKQRLIEYFDAIEPKNYQEEWLNFLRMHYAK